MFIFIFWTFIYLYLILNLCYPIFAGVFDDDGYWDVVAEYCKNSPQDILCEYTVYCRGNKDAKIWLLPTVWFR